MDTGMTPDVMVQTLLADVGHDPAADDGVIVITVASRRRSGEPVPADGPEVRGRTGIITSPGVVVANGGPGMERLWTGLVRWMGKAMLELRQPQMLARPPEEVH